MKSPVKPWFYAIADAVIARAQTVKNELDSKGIPITKWRTFPITNEEARALVLYFDAQGLRPSEAVADIDYYLGDADNPWTMLRGGTLLGMRLVPLEGESLSLVNDQPPLPMPDIVSVPHSSLLAAGGGL